MTRVAVLIVCILALVPALGVRAERLGYPPEEFIARRGALAKALGGGTLLLFGSTMPSNGSRFRQDNDFYYFTGSEDLNAVLLMDGATGEAQLFLPEQSEGEIRSDGRNWLRQPDAAKRWASPRCRRCRC